jgi:hypothetical protein
MPSAVTGSVGDMSSLLLIILIVGGAWFIARAVNQSHQRKALERKRGEDLEAVRRVTDEDVTRFGEELQRLDTDLLAEPLDEAARQDYQRALDSYESAKASLERVRSPEEIRHVTEALEDGRYAAACVRARVSGQPLPVRRPPCFFNPAHGPSTTDIEWAPPGGQPRKVPVCAADADRVTQGAEPDVRTVPQGVGRVPYWQAGPAYSPWASGYFGGYATSGLLPTFLLMGMLSPGWVGGGDPFYDGDYGDGDGGGDGDGYGGEGGDGGDGGSDGGDGGDFGGGGDGGDLDFGGGGFDFGGGDGGGFDFGGGDFGF